MTLEEYFVSDNFFKSMFAVKNDLLNNNTADKIRLLNFIIGNRNDHKRILWQADQ